MSTTLGDLTLALARLPKEYLLEPWFDVKICEYRGYLVACHPAHKPMLFVRGRWTCVEPLEPAP